MNETVIEIVKSLDSQANECYDFVRNRFDDPYGEWEVMWDKIIDLRSTLEQLKRELNICPIPGNLPSSCTSR